MRRAPTLSASPVKFLPTFSVPPARVYSYGRRLVAGYSGPIIRVVKPSDQAQELDIYAGADNKLNLTGVAAFQGADAYLEIKTRYEQTGTGDHQVQTTQNQRPRLVTSLTQNGNYFAIVNGSTASTTERMPYPSGVSFSAQNFTRLDLYHYMGSSRACLWTMGSNSFTAPSVVFCPGNNGNAAGGINGWRSAAVIDNTTVRTASSSRGRSQPQVTCLVSGAASTTLYQDDTTYTGLGAATSSSSFSGGLDYLVDSTQPFQGRHFDTILWNSSSVTAWDYAAARRFLIETYGLMPYYDTQLIWAGNSIAFGLRTLNTQNMQHYMEPQLKRPIFITNQGASGQLMLTMRDNITVYTGQKRSDLVKNLIIGIEPTNDIDALVSGSIVGQESVYQGYATTIANACAAAGMPLAMPTTTARNWSGSGTDKTQKTGVKDAYNTWLKANAATLGYTVLDYDAQSESQNTANTTYYDADQIHWTSTLAQLQAARVLTWVNSQL